MKHATHDPPPLLPKDGLKFMRQLFRLMALRTFTSLNFMARRSSLAQIIVVGFACAFAAPGLPAQTFGVVHYFTNHAQGRFPESEVVADGDTLYGTASSVVYRARTDGTGYTVLKQFTNTVDGNHLAAGLVLSGSTLYGAAASGGTNSYGTIFKLDTNGMDFTVLRFFTNSPDGRMPYNSLLLVNDTLFGTTYQGGASGGGTVFTLNPNGSDYAVLKSFTNNVDGSFPYGPLVSDGSALYGVTGVGGTNGAGTIFKIGHDGSNFAVLKSFGYSLSSSEGSHRSPGLVLNGTTLYGTATGGSNVAGVVFKISTDGTDYRVLWHFAFVPDGTDPNGLTMAGGTLYGTMYSGSVTGGPAGNGLVYRINVDGSGYAALKAFSDFVPANYHVNTDGAHPQARVVMSGGMLFGTTYTGGFDYNPGSSEYDDGGGVVFRLTVTNSLTILTGDGCFGVKSNHFGFTAVGAYDQMVVVEACTNLTTPEWFPLQTNSLGVGGFYFLDLDWTNHPGRYYRLRSL